MKRTENKKPVAVLIGQDGNIFNLMGIAAKALRRNNQQELVPEMQKEVTSSKSYDEALVVLMKYVDVR